MISSPTKRWINPMISLAVGSFPSLWRDVDSVFVLSTGRTGTETLKHLFELSDRVSAFHEPEPQLLEERKRARVEVYDQAAKYTKIFARARGAALYREVLRGKIYAETSARLTFFAPVIAELLPNARFIYIHRHPGGIVRSGMRRKWYVDHEADYARIEPAPNEAAKKEWDTWDPFTKICWYWDAYNRFSLNFAESIDSSRVLSLDAGSIFDGSAAARIFSFIGAEAPPQSKISAVLSKKHNAQHSEQFPRFENWPPEMRRVLYNIAGDTMRSLGYRTESIPSIREDVVAVASVNGRSDD